MSVTVARTLRIGAAVLFSAVSIQAAGFSAIAAARAGELGRVAELFADDGLVGLQGELQALAENPEHRLEPKRIQNARLTLINRPLNSQVFAGLALAAGNDVNGQASADRFMVLADRIGRREPISQLWLIEKSAAAGDVPGTLRHYNRILSARPELSATLFPVLAAAIDFPEVRQAVLPYLRSQRPWIKDFIIFAATNSKLDGLVRLLAPNLHLIRDERYMEAKSEAVFRLAEAGQRDEALAFAKNAYSNLDLAAFSTFAISRTTLDKRLGRFAWQMVENENVQTAIGEDGSVEVTIQPATQADVLTRHILLRETQERPVRFVVESRNGGREVVFDLSVSCAESGRPITSSKVYRFAPEGPALEFSGVEDLQGCELAFVSLKALAPDGQTPFVSIIRVL